MFARFNLSALYRRRPAKFALAFFAAVLVITLVTFTARARREKKGVVVGRASIAAQPTPQSNARGYVRRALLRPQLQYALNVLGDRVEKPGKERLIYVGTLRRRDSGQAMPLRVALELPAQMRLEEGAGSHPRVIGFDGARAWAGDGSLSDDDLAVIETLVLDSPEHFLLSQTLGYATRFLGYRFRLDEAPVTKDTTFYDIYQIEDRINIGETSRSQPKMFYLNSRTQLLERVYYEIINNGQPIKVEVLLNGWEKSGDQQIPKSITRLENGEETLRIAVNATVVSGRANDGMFNAPQGR